MSRIADLKAQLRSPLNWHLAGGGILFAAVLVLGARFTFDLIEVGSSKSDELHSRQTQLAVLEAQTAPLRGLDKKVEASRAAIKEFMAKRVPANYSTIATSLGDVAVKNGVRLTRVTYGKGKPDNELTEVPIDASIGGEYTSVLRFINGLERDENFFVVRGMTLTGQQGGTVNLRLQVSTWMRPADAANAPANAEEGKDGKPGDTGGGSATPAPAEKNGGASAPRGKGNANPAVNKNKEGV